MSSVSSIVGPGLLIGAYSLFILAGITMALMEKRLESSREH